MPRCGGLQLAASLPLSLGSSSLQSAYLGHTEGESLVSLGLAGAEAPETEGVQAEPLRGASEPLAWAGQLGH